MRYDVFVHDWAATEAHRLFVGAFVDAKGRRFATARGLAFEARASADGTWHGFPIPWETVPPELKDNWMDQGLVDGRSIKLFQGFAKEDVHWPLRTDE